jgi:hypothetical protein
MSYFQLSSLRIALCNIPPKNFPLWAIKQKNSGAAQKLTSSVSEKDFFSFFILVCFSSLLGFVGEGFLVCLDGGDHTSLHQDKWDYSAYCRTRTFWYVHLNLQGIFWSHKTILSWWTRVCFLSGYTSISRASFDFTKPSWADEQGSSSGTQGFGRFFDLTKWSKSC